LLLQVIISLIWSTKPPEVDFGLVGGNALGWTEDCSSVFGYLVAIRTACADNLLIVLAIRLPGQLATTELRMLTKWF